MPKLHKISVAFIRCFFDFDFCQISEMSYPEVEDGGSSDKPNPFTQNFNNLGAVHMEVS